MVAPNPLGKLILMLFLLFHWFVIYVESTIFYPSCKEASPFMTGPKEIFEMEKDKYKLFSTEEPSVHSDSLLEFVALKNQTNFQSRSYLRLEFETVNYISLTDTLDFTVRFFFFDFFFHRDQSKTHNVRENI